MINDWRLEEAEKEIAQLTKARPNDSETMFVEATLAFHHGDYETAAQRFREAVAKDPRPGPLGDEMRMMRDLARATADATRNFVEHKGEHFIIKTPAGKDELLVPYALEALEKAYAVLGEDFGDRPSQPIRVEIYPEVADLAKVSTLTLREIETSGTIALCKWNRLMIVSPRALITGYPWLDTLAHEYTHFIVSRVSYNTVPIWLHEGLAKFEEQKWRKKGSSALSPTMEHLLATGIAKKRLITFAEMHPSMAKLPSQDDTALAFAEVYMAVAYLHEKIGWEGVRQIVASLRAGKEIGDAVGGALGKSFAEFQSEWKAWLSAQKLRQRPGLVPNQLRFKKGPREKEIDDAELIAEERARKHARLGGMLRARRRLGAAAAEYEKAQALVGPGNIQVANKLARTWLELGDAEKAIAAAEPAIELYPETAAAAATVGEAWLRRGAPEKAEPYLLTALAVSPFDPLVHCGLSKVYKQRDSTRAEREEKVCASLSSR